MQSAPIGVLDSGMGGLSVLHALKRAMPHERFIYFGDNANAPYGPRPPEEIRALTLRTARALMARGAREVARLIHAMGGNELSAYGLCHLGDYEATLFSRHSHNRQFGESYIRGESYGALAEGVPTAKALVRLGAQCGVELPISETVYRILYENENALDALKALFARSVKGEFYL